MNLSFKLCLTGCFGFSDLEVEAKPKRGLLGVITLGIYDSFGQT